MITPIHQCQMFAASMRSAYRSPWMIPRSVAAPPGYPPDPAVSRGPITPSPSKSSSKHISMRASRPGGISSSVHLRRITCLSSAWKSNACRQSTQLSRCRWICSRVVDDNSSSRKASSSRSVCLQSAIVADRSVSSSVVPRRLGGCGLCCREAPRLGELVQRALHRFSSPVKPRHHGADRDVEHLGDLLVREALHVGEDHRQPEVVGQFLERPLDLVIGEQVEELVLGRLAGGGSLHRPEPAVQVEVL